MLALAVLLAAACTPASKTAPVSDTSPPPEITAAAPAAKPTPAARPERLLVEINTARARHGLEPVRRDARLAAAARRQAASMAEGDFFDHRAPDGSGLSARVVGAGYAYSHVAENPAGGHERARDVVATWLLSDGHRRNLLNPEVVDAGIGYIDAPSDGGRVRYRHYWVAIFGRGPR